MAVIEQSLRRHLAAGVTTVRDLGDRRFAVLDWRSSARGGGVYPAVVAAGPPITNVGGHCANMGGEAAGPGQLRAAVRERADRGVDVVKIMTSRLVAAAGGWYGPADAARDRSAWRPSTGYDGVVGLPASFRRTRGCRVSGRVGRVPGRPEPAA
jgi:hypothetical protein